MYIVKWEHICIVSLTLQENELFANWMSIVGERLKDLEPDMIYRNKRVCDYHFKPEHKVSGQRLLHLSVPSIYLSGIFHSASTAVYMEHNYSQPRMWPCETRANEDNDVPLYQQILDKGTLHCDEYLIITGNDCVAIKCLSINCIHTRFGIAPPSFFSYKSDRQKDKIWVP
ncbi:unnamed protein product [Colias eurytheme]|nr:unnamed protein product [Colias eurytheme]